MIEDWQFLEALQLAEAMGEAQTLDSGLKRYQHLTKSCDPTIQSELQRLKVLSNEWLKVEAEHGQGSLLNLQHPLIQKHVGYGIVTPQEVTNANRYRCQATNLASAVA